MLKSRKIWFLMMAGALAGWLFSIIGIIRPFENEKVRAMWKRILFTWALGHPLELLVAMPIGKSAGIPALRTIVKTIIFGFTWWLPLYLKVIRR
jgi:hypothetical protein